MTQTGPPPAGGRPASSPENPYAVRVVAQKISDWIGRLGAVWVDGEIAQLSRRSGSRTAYLTLRDSAVDFSLPVTCATHVLDELPSPLREGARVLVHCKPDFWVQRGSFSMRAREIRHVGLGELLARIERLRQVLEAEGLFDVRRKRSLPFLPATIGLVTGRESAAEQDVLTNARLRWPGVRFKTINCVVQGRTAAGEVTAAIRELDTDPQVEVIIVARGGGSIEDLLPFSDEELCRAVGALTTPLVSAIGHEPDTPLLDYVADVRASTPTDAAKRVVPDVAEEIALVGSGRARIRNTMQRLLSQERAVISQLRSRPSLADPQGLIDDRQMHIDRQLATIRSIVAHGIDIAQTNIQHTRAQLVALSPHSTLKRGYAVLQDHHGAIVTRPTDVRVGDKVHATLAGGRLDLSVTSHESVSSHESADPVIEESTS
ncbi:MAG: exodeoxyribonuclease VII large subunit [Antricoccus sp.]